MLRKRRRGTAGERRQAGGGKHDQDGERGGAFHMTLRRCTFDTVGEPEFEIAGGRSNVKNRLDHRPDACDVECAHLSCRHDGAGKFDTARQARSQGAFVITAFNRRTHLRAFLVASIACLNLSQPAAAYTESWMNDQDVKAYAQQHAKHAPVASSSAAAVKPARQAARSPSKAPAAAHADAKPASKPHAAPAKTGKVQHAASADPKAHAVAKPKAAPAAHTIATLQR
ncbi:hypothetical protein [Burkholderia ambifaria]|nr:hypothetical protein [Burkholderia ambifaria]WDS00975.1 hypothetical protein OR985_09985 [Burkholderia ambifaria]